MKETLLGKNVSFPETYSPDLLQSISRNDGRARLGAKISFSGFDLWNCYEVSWLSPSGIPRTSALRIIYPAESEAVIESKSLKLYLGSLNSQAFSKDENVPLEVSAKLSRLVGAHCQVYFLNVSDLTPQPILGKLLESELPGAIISDAGPDHKSLVASTRLTEETLSTDLFRSLCPITGQPDWASVEITYKGGKLSEAPLLNYLLSFRKHQAFHEDCCEKIFTDIRAALEKNNTFSELRVACRFLRRGGIDLNPVRFTPGLAVRTLSRSLRQ